MAQILLPSLRRLALTALASAAMVLLGALLLTVSPPAAHAVASPSPPAVAPVEPATLARAVAEMEQLDRMRIALASTLAGRSEEPSCLACHGTKASRAAFVKDNYPDDKAFDFQVGDLRGMYAVFIPETPQTRDTLGKASG